MIYKFKIVGTGKICSASLQLLIFYKKIFYISSKIINVLA